MLDYWMPLFHVIMGYFIIMIPMLLIIWGAFSNGSPKTKTVVACFLKIVGILVFLVALEHYYKGMFFYISLFIGGFAAMPQPVVLIFHGLLNGMTLDGIAAALHTTRTNARALIEKASREYWMVADVYRANGHLLEGKR